MIKKQYILALFALLVFTMAAAQTQHHDNRKQEYIYHTDDQRINEAINTVCKDSKSDTVKEIVREAIRFYLDEEKNMEKNWNGKRVEPSEASKEVKNLDKQIKEIKEQIDKYSINVDEGKEEQEQKWTTHQLDSIRKVLNDSLSKKQNQYISITDLNLYVKSYNKWVQHQNSYMDKHQLEIEKSLDDLLEEANQLMAGRYNKAKNDTLAQELKKRFNKDKKAQDVIKHLKGEESAMTFIKDVSNDIENLFEYVKSDYIEGEKAKFVERYEGRYPKFIEFFDKLNKLYINKKLKKDSAKKIIKDLIDNE